jgi:hypothetical protein
MPVNIIKVKATIKIVRRMFALSIELENSTFEKNLNSILRKYF